MSEGPQHDPLTFSLGLDFAPAIRCCFDMRDYCLEVLKLIDETGLEDGAEHRRELQRRLETMNELLERVLEINAASLREVKAKPHDYYYFGEHSHLNRKDR